jgi:hypothetical protein
MDKSIPSVVNREVTSWFFEHIIILQYVNTCYIFLRYSSICNFFSYVTRIFSHIFNWFKLKLWMIPFTYSFKIIFASTCYLKCLFVNPAQAVNFNYVGANSCRNVGKGCVRVSKFGRLPPNAPRNHKIWPQNSDSVRSEFWGSAEFLNSGLRT